VNKYLVLYRTEGALDGPSVAEMMAHTPPEQMQAGMALWQAWFAKSGNAVADFGAPLDKSTTVKEGSAARGKTTITGYTVLQAASLEEAIKLLDGHPHFRAPGASMEILECVRIPGVPG
jgi:hypothetical protein